MRLSVGISLSSFPKRERGGRNYLPFVKQKQKVPLKQFNGYVYRVLNVQWGMKTLEKTTTTL